MTQKDALINARGERLERDRVAATTIEPYAHEVVITLKGVKLAQTRRGQLLRETYAPDIYVPAADVCLELLTPSETETYCPYKTGIAEHYDATANGSRIDDVAWCYVNPLGLPALRGHYAFYFDKVKIEVDGQLVRGHVRDPHKVISVKPVGAPLQMEIAGHVVVNTDGALLLEETGLPSRYYVPQDDVDANCLVDSNRISVCTYKGEATYHHLQVGGRVIENAVWAYTEPWTDFSTEVGMIKGYRGFYSSSFDRILVGKEVVDDTAKDAEADRAMIASPTVDQMLRERKSV